jgi:hypothetical protein
MQVAYAMMIGRTVPLNPYPNNNNNKFTYCISTLAEQAVKQNYFTSYNPGYL